MRSRSGADETSHRGAVAAAVAVVGVSVLALLLTVAARIGPADGTDSSFYAGDAYVDITTPPEEPERRVDDTESPEVLFMADDLGIEPSEASSLLVEQGRLGDYVYSVSDHPGFVTYRGIFAEGGALLIVEPGFETAGPFANPPAGLSVRAADATSEERASTLREIEATASRIAGDTYVAVAHDAFENTYTVWFETDGLRTEVADAILDSLAGKALANTTATIEFAESARFEEPAGVLEPSG